MEIRIDPHSRVPIYAQIVECIKHMVARGELRPGQQLPTIRRLAVDLRVDPNTVAHAYRILDAEGVISTQRGRGTFITERPDEKRLTEMRREKLRAIMGGALLEALSLGYSPAEVRNAFEQLLKEWQRENNR